MSPTMPYGYIDKNDSVMYDPKLHSKQMFLPLMRLKGSTGDINISWKVEFQQSSFKVSPELGEVLMREGQWNSSMRLQFYSIPENEKDVYIFVHLFNISGGASFRNTTRVKIVFSSKFFVSTKTRTTDKNNLIFNIVLPSVGACFGLILIISVIVILYRRCFRRRYDTV